MSLFCRIQSAAAITSLVRELPSAAVVRRSTRLAFRATPGYNEELLPASPATIVP